MVEVMRSQNEALNRKDADAYMATIHPDAPGFAATKGMSEQLFKTFDLRYTLEKTEVLSFGEEEATLYVIQLTEKVSGPDFRNNRYDAVHTLKKHNGEWKIFGSKINKVEFLDN